MTSAKESHFILEDDGVGHRRRGDTTNPRWKSGRKYEGLLDETANQEPRNHKEDLVNFDDDDYHSQGSSSFHDDGSFKNGEMFEYSDDASLGSAGQRNSNAFGDSEVSSNNAAPGLNSLDPFALGGDGGAETSSMMNTAPADFANEGEADYQKQQFQSNREDLIAEFASLEFKDHPMGATQKQGAAGTKARDAGQGAYMDDPDMRAFAGFDNDSHPIMIQVNEPEMPRQGSFSSHGSQHSQQSSNYDDAQDDFEGGLEEQFSRNIDASAAPKRPMTQAGRNAKAAATKKTGGSVWSRWFGGSSGNSSVGISLPKTDKQKLRNVSTGDKTVDDKINQFFQSKDRYEQMCVILHEYKSHYEKLASSDRDMGMLLHDLAMKDPDVDVRDKMERLSNVCKAGKRRTDLYLVGLDFISQRMDVLVEKAFKDSAGSIMDLLKQQQELDAAEARLAAAQSGTVHNGGKWMDPDVIYEDVQNKTREMSKSMTVICQKLDMLDASSRNLAVLLSETLTGTMLAYQTGDEDTLREELKKRGFSTKMDQTVMQKIV
eukprot:Clim_evm10s243 gene=Clim_evmTU10s243